MYKFILKNSSYLLVSQVISKGLAFLYTLFLLRNLAVEQYGLYTVALSYFSLLGLLADFGINSYLIREISRDESKSSRIFSGTLVLRTVAALLLLLAFSLVLIVLDPHDARTYLSIIAVSAIVPQSIALTCDAFFIAKQRIPISAIGLFILNVSSVIIGIGLVSAGGGVLGAVVAVMLSQVIYAGFLLALTFRRVEIKWPKATKEYLKTIAIESLPFGILAILGMFYFKIDILLLGYMRGVYEAGIYGSAYKFYEAIIFIPSAFSATLFPLIARSTRTSPRQTYEIYKKSLLFNGTISLPIFLGFYYLLPFFLDLILPATSDYRLAFPVLRILAFSIPFFFLISAQTLVLLSHKRFLKPLLWISIFNLALNLSLNILLIPRYGYYASAWITVLSDIVGFVIFTIFIWLQFRPQRA